MSSFKNINLIHVFSTKTHQWLASVVRIKYKILNMDNKVSVLEPLPASLPRLTPPSSAHSTGATGASVPPTSEAFSYLRAFV